jgi:uncharacterized alkaline shock family protein YloU
MPKGCCLATITTLCHFKYPFLRYNNYHWANKMSQTAKDFIIDLKMNQVTLEGLRKFDMTDQSNPLGNIYILPQAIATVARQYTLLSYGVIGLAPKNILEAIKHFFRKDANYGIKVNSDSTGLTIDIYIIVEYGMRIKTLTDSVANSVKYNVEKTIGIPVNRINVHVRGLRISNPD